ncbi:hypothetical protein, partial [Alkalibacillus haloalkaliphilus]|uniref:hypothetical protein n=1 Tax=Alkalibacillus haloalkaliphilus TaxID=94136 RepID=UPI0029367A3B
LPKIRLNTLYAFPILVSKGLRGLKSQPQLISAHENLSALSLNLSALTKFYQRSQIFISAQPELISTHENHHPPPPQKNIHIPPTQAYNFTE